MRVLIVSNLDSARPFGQFTRPFHLGRGIAEAGIDVANVGVDCSAVDFGRSWSVRSKSLRRLLRVVALARGRFLPDVIYAHQNLPGTAALLVARDVPVVGDFHALASVEWAALVRGSTARQRVAYRLASYRALATEAFVARRCAAIIAAGQYLADEIARRYRLTGTPAVVPNGVDRRLIEQPPSDESPFSTDRRGPHAIATLPSSASPSNRRALEFLCAVGHRLNRSSSAPVLHVLGTDRGPACSHVRYEGVQPDLLPWIECADVCLLPYPSDAMLFGGAKNKLLEYLARGRRIVTTPEGLRGLEEAAEWTGVQVVADDPDAFARAVKAAVDPSAPTISEGRNAVRDRLRWDVLAQDVVHELQRVAYSR